MSGRPPPLEDFYIAVICALEFEAEVVDSLFGTVWKGGGAEIDGGSDRNSYTLGRIGSHNVVLVWMPRMGKTTATAAATRLNTTFHSIKLVLIVGICGGMPEYTTTEEEPAEILLGDVIISTGIMHYDSGGKQLPNTYLSNVGITNPSNEISGFLRKLGAHRERNSLNRDALLYLERLGKVPHLKPGHPGPGEDKLYRPDYPHKHHDHVSSGCGICAGPGDNLRDCETARALSCNQLKCSEKELEPRKRLEDIKKLTPAAQVDALKPVVHFGLVASGDTVMRSGQHRDGIACRGAQKPIAFEMEAAGVWDAFPGNVVVIKGVCDYADSHKNKKWQRYAAVTGGAYMRAFLDHWIPPRKPSMTEWVVSPWAPDTNTIPESSNKLDSKESIKSLDSSPTLFAASPVESLGSYFEAKPGSISSYEAPKDIAVLVEKVQSLETERLFTACQQRRVRVVEQLLQAQGVDLSARTRDGQSMLHLAIGSVKVNANKTLMQDIAAIVKLLCARGADVNAVDGCGLCPIHYCVKSMNIEAAECLLECKANVNLPDANNETALYTMAEEPYPDKSFADMLLKKGGNLGQKKLPPLRNRPNFKQGKVRELIRKYKRN
ncbi:MAG: hypothetical protein M1840_007246 [Geoglossum simile]|nr:MAG: hypothetical protein M1840_007246 [Geoglossum simile]